MTKREVVERIRRIDAEARLLGEERAMLVELLSEWPDGDSALALLSDEEPPDTEPGTPRTKSSQRMAAVRPDPDPEPIR